MIRSAGIILGLSCLLVSITQSLYMLIQHLRHFTKPEYQLYICRIILMVPIYCCTSYMSIIYPEFEEILNMLRDSYEAFVIYSFTMLLINYVGGERRLSINLELKEYISHPWPLHYCFRSFRPSSNFLRLVKIGVLQFVILRPFLSFLSIVLRSQKLYHDGNYSFQDGFLYIFVLNNLSFTAALYGLGMLFVATEELLEPFRPIPKFLCIKGVIFFCFWQGIALGVLESVGVITKDDGLKAREVAGLYQNILVCVEMLVASFAHSVAFAYDEYSNGLGEIYKPFNKNYADNIKSILSAHDVIKEVKDSISPKEYDFELTQDN